MIKCYTLDYKTNIILYYGFRINSGLSLKSVKMSFITVIEATTIEASLKEHLVLH